jgi:TetR/AcrR family transcriptional regulator, transcriptional repressor for nem operon
MRNVSRWQCRQCLEEAQSAELISLIRQPQLLREVGTRKFRRKATGLVPPNGTSDRRARAILMISAMLGAINLSRAVSDPNLSREILQQTRGQLVTLNKPAKTT